MANFKISTLKPTSILDDTATIPCIYNGQTYQLSVAALTAYFGTGIFKAIFSGDSIQCDPNPIISSGTISFSGTGLMSLYAGATDPDGWLICNGRELSRNDSKYSNLFSIVGTQYGTPTNSSLFKIPDISGLAVFGIDNMGGITSGRLTQNNLDGANPLVLGSSGGNAQVTLTADQCPLQTHAHSTGTIPWKIAWAQGCTCCNYGSSSSVERKFRFDSANFYADKNKTGRSWVYADAQIGLQNSGGVDQIKAAAQVNTTTSHPHIPPLILLNWIIRL